MFVYYGLHSQTQAHTHTDFPSAFTVSLNKERGRDVCVLDTHGGLNWNSWAHLML